MLEGKELTNLRKNFAKKLTNSIHHELKELYMEKTVFEVSFESDEHYISQIGWIMLNFIYQLILGNR